MTRALRQQPRVVAEHVSNQTNILRGVGPTAMNAAKTHCVNGHELTPDNIRRLGLGA